MLLNVALAQIDIAFGEPQANLATLRPLAATAAARGAALLVLPELWSTGYDLARAAELADEPGSGMHAALAALAQEQGIAIAGSTLTRRGAQITNTATLYGPDGALLLSYDKLHLFGLLHEDRYLAPGDALAVSDAPWGRTALGICYDLRFPEQWRACALQGAALLLVPAEWPTPRREHWRVLVQARAIENQCFVVAVNRVGSDPDTHFGGHSLVVGPWGEVLAEGGDTAELLFASLDMEAVAAARARIRVWDDRRPDVYAAALSGPLAAPQGAGEL
jgi:predicted amidohydrolase